MSASTDTLDVVVSPPADIVKTGDTIEVTASTPTQMAECQHSVIAWMEAKLARTKLDTQAAQSEADELGEAFKSAQAKKWKTSIINKHWRLAQKRVEMSLKREEYYQKLLTALRAGYYIVPPMDMTVFAIRTDRKKPQHRYSYLTWDGGRNFEQDCRVLPEGEGKYQNPNPNVRVDYSKDVKDEKTGLIKRPHWADAWEAIEFPITMLKPRIMEATSRAMALKVFDELGVLPQDMRRNPDPVIMGRIYEPKKTTYHHPKVITFMIAWHLNTKDL